MDTKFVDGLLASLQAQRNSALDEAARLNASLISVTSERDKIKAKASEALAVVDGLVDVIPLGDGHAESIDSIARAKSSLEAVIHGS